MSGVVVVGLLVAGAVVALHMFLTFKSGGFAAGSGLWVGCPCGHAASWHEVSGQGCRKNMAGKPGSDCYGYCPCPATRGDVLAQDAVNQ